MKTGIYQLTEHDRSVLADHLLRLSPRDRRLRFLSPASDSVIRQFVKGVAIDQVYGFFVAGQLVANSMVMPDEDDCVEFAVSVDVEHRGHGLARQMLDHGIQSSRAERADLVIIRHASDNHAMAAVHRGLPSTQHLEAGEVDVLIDLQQLRRELCDTMSRLVGEEL